MGKRLGKALQALAVVLLITLGCLAFMPWKMGEVIEPLESAKRCMILRYDHTYSTAYPQDEKLETVKSVMMDATGHFDRNRSSVAYEGDAPLYRIYLWTGDGRIPDVWICGNAFFYEGAQFILDEEDAAALNTVLADSFS